MKLPNLLGPNASVRALFDSLQAVLGPGEIERDVLNGSAFYKVHGHIAGRPVRATVLTDGGILSALVFVAPLEGRPITWMVNHRRNTTILGVPEVRTGDPDFDAVFLVNGFPSEVLTDALDDRTRRWLLDGFRVEDPRLETAKDALTISVPVRTMQGLWALPSGRVMPPEEVAQRFDTLLDLRDRLAASFDRHVERMTSEQGAEASKRWVQGHRRAMTERDTRRQRLRWLLVFVFIVLPLAFSFAFAAVVIITMHSK